MPTGDIKFWGKRWDGKDPDIEGHPVWGKGERF